MSLAFSRLSATPLLQTLHHPPSRAGGRAVVALSARRRSSPCRSEQARLLAGLNVVGIVHHAMDTDAFAFRADPDDYLLFLGRFTEGKGVLQAIDVARRVGHAPDAGGRGERLLP